MYKLNRIIGTLWLPFDSFNSCSSSSKPSICPRISWTGTRNILCLVIAAMVTFYSYNLISLVLEHHAQLGCRYHRFRDMAKDILGMNTTFPTLFFGPLYDYIYKWSNIHTHNIQIEYIVVI